ncbi:hypothetical protein SAMN04490181_1501 [Pseudomonas brenneri]|jgi:hypothetical protein|uniref:Uncharacterized protein n=1 Tax=Pseudomonas brenneri TaxID=129817 RepID=A0ABY0WA01_9PSED|nr:hypothetical protein [Pseudomonas sp. 25 R 14]SDU91674.1 hypothetical protein SAMN04490181_1501 [Pseudomonas brenneri]
MYWASPDPVDLDQRLGHCCQVVEIKLKHNCPKVPAIGDKGSNGVTRATRNLRKTLDSVADNNETAAFDLMRAVEKLSDEVLRQRLLNTIHRLNQDAHELREARDAVERVSVKLA